MQSELDTKPKVMVRGLKCRRQQGEGRVMRHLP
jgi:hypothetical protein